MTAVFVTGASGFLGRQVVVALMTRGHAVHALTRPGRTVPTDVSAVFGTLEALPDLTTTVPRGAVVIHLAAQTGRATPERFDSTNVDGTRNLLTATRALGASRFVFISSIAATYDDVGSYPYAESKRRGEVLVREAGLPYDIVRPTILLGAGSPAWAGLARLAGGPVGIRFGPSEVTTQPIHVLDAAEALGDLLGHPPSDLAWDLGGTDTLSLRKLLSQIRLATRGSSGPFVTLPLKPVRMALAALEAAFGPRLPLTAAQLAVFANDSVVRTTPSWTPAIHRGLATMLQGSM